ncbi:MAG: methyltransferase [Gammaproteobacteria bacterium]|nr:methyltransferase [Gammaproteobacteria bacterium]
MDNDDYLKQLRKDLVIQETLCEQPLTFHSTWGIFSPREIDEGTRLLLKYVEINDAADIFDLGCGYGPIGITLAKLAPEGRTLMVDKDFVAVEYAKKNIALNQLNNCEAMLSNGFEHIGNRQFDVVISNVPAKVGKEMMHIILSDAHRHLRPGGQIYVVTINGLRDYIKRNFKEFFGNYDKLKQGTNYTVAKAVKE